jgi:hypothetical protein
MSFVVDRVVQSFGEFTHLTQDGASYPKKKESGNDDTRNV